MTMPHRSLLLALMLGAALTACGKQEEAAQLQTSAAAPSAAAVVATAEAVAAVDAPAKYRASCASCHGEMGEGVDKNPKLAGLKRDEINAKLADYRAGKQMGPQTAVMAATAKALSDAEIVALAVYVGE